MWRKKSHIKEYQKIDTSVGEYTLAVRVFKMEGGTQEDIAPTHRLLRNNMSMGWPHVVYNEETERYDFLYVRRQRRALGAKGAGNKEGQMPQALQPRPRKR